MEMSTPSRVDMQSPHTFVLVFPLFYHQLLDFQQDCSKDHNVPPLKQADTNHVTDGQSDRHPGEGVIIHLCQHNTCRHISSELSKLWTQV